MTNVSTNAFSMSPRPRVTVVITTYNRAPLLVEAVESVLNQTYRDFELIVADDGSTDDTAQRLSAYGSRLRYLPLAHDGRPEVVRNQAIAAARGGFFAFLDDDDLWHEEKLSGAMALLEGDPRLGYVYGDCRFLDTDGSLSPPLLSPRQRTTENVFADLLQGCFVHPSTVVIRRSVFEEVGPFPETFLCQGDYYLWLRAAHTAPVACVTEPLVYLRRYPDSLALRWRLRNLENAILVVERVRREVPLTWGQRWRSRRTLSRWHATLGLRRRSARAARRDLLRSLFMNPLQRTAWRALLKALRAG